MQKNTPMRQIDERTKVPAHTHALPRFEGVNKFKSVWRAMRRGQVGRDGTIYPKRPFNNSKRTRGRKHQKLFEQNLIQVRHILDKERSIDEKNAEER